MINALTILKRQGFNELRHAENEPASIWQGPDGRRVLVEDGRIYTKADIEMRARENCGPDTRDYYFAVVHNWG